MNRKRRPFMKTIPLLSLCAALAATADGAETPAYELRSVTLSNGGGASTGGRYELRDTLGQQTTATASGGRFTFSGGFWNIIATIPTPGAPPLAIERAVSQVVISWPAVATGWELQRTARLEAPNWTDVSAPVVIVGDRRTVTVSLVGTGTFYRLRRTEP